MCSQAPRKLRPDWSSPPADVIKLISSLIADDSDYVRFRSVCHPWRSAAPKRPLIPWLLVEDNPNSLSLCNFPNTDFSSAPRLPRDIIQGKFMCGSSLGWIALLDDSRIISLHNPFIGGVHISLPPLFNLPWIEGHVFDFYSSVSFARKLVLSSDPRIPSCIVMAFSNKYKRLIYCHPEDASWTPLPPLPIDDNEVLEDILFYRGKFYVVRGFKLFVIDIGHGNAQVTQVLPMDPLFSDGEEGEGYSGDITSYLVESSGDLLLVSLTHDATCANSDDDNEFSFVVFRVDLDFGETPNGRFSLFNLDSLGGRSFFLSLDSMSVSGDSPSCKGNSIYFIPDENTYTYGVFVFSVEDNSLSSVTGFEEDFFPNSDHSSGTDTDDDFDTSFSEKRIRNFLLSWLTPSLC